jgi:hypothetical protein
MRWPAAALVAAALIIRWSSDSWAHSAASAVIPSPPLTSSVASPHNVSPAVWILCALAATALLIAAGFGRRSRRIALIALTLWMGFQAGTHAVHHLGQPADEARCAVASFVSHGSVITADTSVLGKVLLPEAWITLDHAPTLHRCGLPATHDGRAPPVPAA